MTAVHTAARPRSVRGALLVAVLALVAGLLSWAPPASAADEDEPPHCRRQAAPGSVRA
ncbi:hypothetical protein [Nocardioides zeae]